jgi:CHAT domain-containing protein
LYSDGTARLRQGYDDAALQLAEQGYRESEPRDAVWSWRFRILKAEALIRKRMPDRAVDLLNAEPPGTVPVDLKIRQRVLYGQALCQLGKRSEGERSLSEAESAIPPDARALRAEMASTRGRCALSGGDKALARLMFTRAVELGRGSDSFVEATALGNLGFISMADQRYDEAIDAFQRVLDLTESPSIREKAFGNLGFSYSQLGDWKRAISFSEQAQLGAKEIKNNVDQEKWLVDLGTAHFALWELPEAEDYYLRALAIAQQLNDRDQAARCLHNLAQLALRRQDLTKAEGYWSQGEALKSESERLRLALDYGEIVAAQKRWEEAANLFEDLAQQTEKNPLLHYLAQLELGKVYWQEGKIARAEQMLREGVHTAEATITQVGDANRLSFLDQVPFYDPYIRFLVSEHRPLDALMMAERSRAQTLMQSSDGKKPQATSFSLPSIQAALKRRQQIALAYWVVDEESYLWVITPAKLELIRLPGHRELQSQIEAYNHELQQHPDVQGSSAGQRLYETVIRPAEKLIPKDAQVIVVPSKVLSLVSFEALVAPAPHPHYWIEDADIQVAGSLATLARRRNPSPFKQRETKKLLLMGAPIEASKDFPTLEHSAEEIQRIQSHFPVDQQTILSGKRATPQSYSSASPGNYRLIHFDTHGTASDLSPLDSAIILSPGSEGSYKLYAREIKDIPLHADLVTISACYGAGTRWYNNEGVVGLGWAFLRAGAHQVIAGLWEADGAATSQLMDDFYSELTQGKSAAEALRDAKLKMLHSSNFYRHPYYWASLQLYTGS